MCNTPRSAVAACVVIVLLAGNALADSISGCYLQIRGEAPANSAATTGSVSGQVGDHAILAWKVTKGDWDGTRLDGLAIVAVVSGDGTTRIGEKAGSQAVLLVDERADAAQQSALVNLAKSLGEKSLPSDAAVKLVKIDLRISEGCARGYAELDAGTVRASTRRVLHEKELETARSGPGHAALAKLYFQFSAYTLEYSCAELQDRERGASFSGTNLANAIVGGF